ncbi:MAG: DapH/DapD/GlmU-related protein [Flavobacteriales bacterium]
MAQGDKVGVSDVYAYVQTIAVCHGFALSENIKVSSVGNPSSVKNNQLIWVSDELVFQRVMGETSGSILIVPLNFEPSSNVNGNAVIAVDHPKWVVARVIKKFFIEQPEWGVHSSAIIHPEAIIHDETFIGPHTYVGRCEISQGTVLDGHNYIYDNVFIGKNVRVHANTVLGSAGSGFVKNPKGDWEEFPQLGALIIRDNVEIGSNTYVNKGALVDTFIGENVKIGLSCCIGHNVKIGRNSMILANSVIAGSTVIEENVYVSIGVTVRNKVTIGANATLGMGTVVTKNVPPNSTLVGNPAKSIS